MSWLVRKELDAAKAELESAQNAYLKKVTGCKETLTEEIKVSEKIRSLKIHF